MTHCTSTIVAFRLVCSAGNATFTTVPSMNAMLEARVVATSTQRPATFEQGALAGRDRIMLSSHGSRIDVSMMASCHRRAVAAQSSVRSRLYGFKRTLNFSFALQLDRSYCLTRWLHILPVFCIAGLQHRRVR